MNDKPEPPVDQESSHRGLLSWISNYVFMICAFVAFLFAAGYDVVVFWESQEDATRISRVYPMPLTGIVRTAINAFPFLLVCLDIRRHICSIKSGLSHRDYVSARHDRIVLNIAIGVLAIVVGMVIGFCFVVA